MTIEKLKTTHDSCPRNKAIANVLFRRGMIEQWGSGKREIIDECVEAGIKQQIFCKFSQTSLENLKIYFFKNVLSKFSYLFNNGIPAVTL